AWPCTGKTSATWAICWRERKWNRHRDRMPESDEERRSVHFGLACSSAKRGTRQGSSRLAPLKGAYIDSSSKRQQVRNDPHSSRTRPAHAEPIVNVMHSAPVDRRDSSPCRRLLYVAEYGLIPRKVKPVLDQQMVRAEIRVLLRRILDVHLMGRHAAAGFETELVVDEQVERVLACPLNADQFMHGPHDRHRLVAKTAVQQLFS